MKEIIKLLRPHQYVKNIFIFAPLLFAFSFDNIELVILSLITFALFSLLASSIYIFNDLMDIEEDRAHPTKKERPLAKGTISPTKAKQLIALFASIPLLLSLLVNTYLFGILLLYFLLNILYSFKLKHISIIDIFIISTGFVLRLFAGSVAVGIGLSMWIIIMTFLLALFLALAKRRDDVLLSIEGKETRRNIDGYNLEFVNAGMVLMSGVIIVSYIFYTVSDAVIARLHTEYLYLSAFFVILGIMRYMQITFVEEKSGSPTKIVLKDRFMQLTILFWLISFYLIVTL
ncbi:MAG: UbiA prenyltransferase family protein [Campylobacterota bacterium]|nr:UbiA prenyltransferase family protein [Campylobacterota bacterium]